MRLSRDRNHSHRAHRLWPWALSIVIGPLVFAGSLHRRPPQTNTQAGTRVKGIRPLVLLRFESFPLTYVWFCGSVLVYTSPLFTRRLSHCYRGFNSAASARLTSHRNLPPRQRKLSVSAKSRLHLFGTLPHDYGCSVWTAIRGDTRPVDAEHAHRGRYRKHGPNGGIERYQQQQL